MLVTSPCRPDTKDVVEQGCYGIVAGLLPKRCGNIVALLQPKMRNGFACGLGQVTCVGGGPMDCPYSVRGLGCPCGMRAIFYFLLENIN